MDDIVALIDDFINKSKPFGLKKDIDVGDYSGLLRLKDLEQIHIKAPAIRICWLNDEAAKPIALGAQDIPVRFGLTIITKDVVYEKQIISAHRLAIEIKDKIRCFLPEMRLANLKKIAFVDRAEAMDLDLDESGNKRIYVLDSAFKLTWNNWEEAKLTGVAQNNISDNLSVADFELMEINHE